MTRYAENTQVSSDRSRAEIEKILLRYGADKFMYGWEDSMAVIAFRAYDRHVRFVLPLPQMSDFQKTPSRLKRPMVLGECQSFCRCRGRQRNECR